jgi:hypothetical protein
MLLYLIITHTFLEDLELNVKSKMIKLSKDNLKNLYTFMFGKDLLGKKSDGNKPKNPS